MSGNTFGQMFRVTTFGESHGPAIGAVVDGCPPGLALEAEDIQPDLDRRRPGTSRLASARRESDRVEILSGVFEGRTTGTPIAMVIQNADAKPGAYEHLKELYRPSHADFTFDAKYGHRAWPGGGRSSARETASRVAAGAIARKLLAEQHGVDIIAWVDRVADVSASVDVATLQLQEVLGSGPIHCPDPDAAQSMVSCIERARKAGDTVGGVIGAVARGVPAGWGDPVFQKLDANLASAMIGLPAAKGFEIGSGFAGTYMRGTEHNDAFAMDEGRVTTKTNRSGGVQGGISNGMAIDFRVGFKPVATHFQEQDTVTTSGEGISFKAKGRHDPCVLPRAVVVVEAMTALVLADAWLCHRGQTGR